MLPIVSIEIKPMIGKLVSFLFLFQYEQNHKNICIYKIAQNLELLDSDWAGWNRLTRHIW